MLFSFLRIFQKSQLTEGVFFLSFGVSINSLSLYFEGLNTSGTESHGRQLFEQLQAQSQTG